MISGNTRSSRSRYSSPAQAAQGGGPLEANKNSANEASRAFMRRWMEPAVQNKASYEEVGMVRYGVLENMQPLGSLPKPSAAAKKGAPEGSGSVRRKIILRASGAGGRKNSADGAKVHRAAAAEEAAQSAALNVPQGSSSSSRPSPASIITPSPPPSSLQSSLSPTHSPSLRSPPPRANSSSTPSQRILFSKHSSRDSLEDESAPLESAPSPHSAPSARNSLAMRDPDNDDDYQPKVSMKRSAATRSPAARRSVTRASAGRQSLPNPGAAGTFTASESDDDTEDAAKTRELVGKVVHEAVQAALDHHRYPSAYALSTLYEENRLDPRVMAMFEDVFLQRADADTIDQFTALVSRRKREGAKNNVAHRHWAPSGSPEKSAPAPCGHLLKNDTGDDTPAQKRKKTTHHADSPSLSRPRKASGAEAGSKSGKGIVGTGKDAKAAPTTPTKTRRRSDSMDSDSSLSSVASFDTPSVHGATSLSIVPKPGSEGSRPRPQIKIKARTSQARLGGETQSEQNAKDTGSGTAGTRAGGSRGRTATPLDAGVAGARDDVSGAPGGRQPMAARGKTAVAQQQRKSPPAATGAGAASGASSTKHNNIHPSSSSTTTTTSTNPVRPGASKTKNRASHSSSPAFSPPDSTLPDHQPPGSRDGAGPDEIASSAKPRDMPGAVAPLFPNLPVKTSGLRTALQSDTPNGDPKKRPSRGSAARTDDPARPRDASVASETRARSETPASARRTRNPAKAAGAASTPAPTGSASRSTRSAVKRAHDEVDGTASPTASTLRSNAPSEAPTRASTPVLPPPSKKQRVGPRVKTS